VLGNRSYLRADCGCVRTLTRQDKKTTANRRGAEWRNGLTLTATQRSFRCPSLPFAMLGLAAEVSSETPWLSFWRKVQE
jgi:hypothetical protein